MIGKGSQSTMRQTALGVMMSASTYGLTVPNTIGRTRNPLLLIWANNYRQSSGGIKKDKKGTQGYSVAVDMLACANPIVGFLRLWSNDTQYDVNLIKVVLPLPGALSQGPVAISDPHFINILGVTVTVPYNVTFDDFGGDGSQTLTGTSELPLWNAAFQGPDPIAPAANKFAPFVYFWKPGSGPSILLPYNWDMQSTFGATAITIYYSQATNENGAQEPAVNRLGFEVEHELGTGSEYANYEDQRIKYPMYAGLGNPGLDLGSAQAAPDLKVEVLGSYPVWGDVTGGTSLSAGDADYVDMIEHVIRQGQSQGTPAATATVARTPMQFGLSCWESPGAVQKKYLAALEPDIFVNPNPYDQPVTAGNILVVAINTGQSSVAPSITDSQGNTWTALFPGTPLDYQVWYTIASATGPNAVTIQGFDFSWDLLMFEFAGVDTIDAVAQASGSGAPDTHSLSITTTNNPGESCYIFAWAANVPGDGPNGASPSSVWKDLIPQSTSGGNTFGMGPVWSFAQYRIVKTPGTYQFSADVGSGGTWRIGMISMRLSQPSSIPQPFGDIIDAPSMQQLRDQDRAYGLYGSVCMDSQRKGQEWLDDFGIAANAAYVWSGFKLKCLPRAEQSFVGNGSIYIAPTASGPVANFGPKDFIADSGGMLVDVKRTGAQNVSSVLQIQHPDREQTSQYAQTVTSQPDNAALAIYGIRKADPKTLTCVQQIQVARKILGVMIRRQQNIRNSYIFKLRAGIANLLEAWDLITITEPNIGIFTLPVRLTSVKEDQDHNFDCEAEPFVYGVHVPVALPVTANGGFQPPVNADPGDVNPPIIFKAQPGMNPGIPGTVLWFGISGADPNWGGAGIFMSLDGSSYTQIGEQIGATPMGPTTADFPVTDNPDVAVDLGVDLTESFGALPNFSNTDEDNFVSLIYLDGGTEACIPYELGSYGIANLTAANQYDISASGGNYIRRAAFQTQMVDHPTGSKFGFFGPGSPASRIAVDPTLIGKQVFFKFPSVNKAMGVNQSLPNVTAYPFTIPAACASSILGAPPALAIPLAPSAAGNFTVPHALGSTPTLVLVQMRTSGNIWLQTPLRYDAGNLYFTASEAGVAGVAFLWNVPAGTEIEIAAAAPGNFQIPNSLGTIPAFLGVQMTSSGNIWSQVPIQADTNFIYLAASGAPLAGFLFAWAIGVPTGGPVNTQFAEQALQPVAAGNFTLAHGLGATPLAAFIRMASSGRIWFQSTPYDNNNLYLTASEAGVVGFAEILLGQFAPTSGTGGFFFNGS